MTNRGPVPLAAHRLPPDHPALAPAPSSMPWTDVRCHNLIGEKDRRREIPGRSDTCGRWLGKAPGVLELILVTRHPAPAGATTVLWYQCDTCRVRNVFRVVPPTG